MRQLSTSDRCRVIACLVEGNSIRATVRITGVAKKTVSRLSVELGQACEKFADKVMINLPCDNLQCDEIWSFTGAKEKNASAAKKAQGWGDTWTWISIDRRTKLIPVWYCGDRSAESAYKLMRNLSPRLANRVQLTTDGHHAYVTRIFAGRRDWSAERNYHGAPKARADLHQPRRAQQPHSQNADAPLYAPHEWI